MKKALIVLMAVIFVFASFPVTTSATQNYNLCDKFEAVNEFHHLYCCYEDMEVVYPGYVEPEIPYGQLYPPHVIIAAAEMIYLENPDKWTVVKTPERDPFDTSAPIVAQKPYDQYVLVPEDEYIGFLRTHFNVTDALINELKNYKVRDYSTIYSENGTAIYNSSNKTFIVPILNHLSYDRNPYRKLIGYVRNGNTYDVYLNKATILHDETPPEGIEYFDYFKMFSEFQNRNFYFVITDDWIKYTVSLNGSNIKYISNVKVNSIPENLIRPNDIVQEEPVFDNTASSPVTDVSSKPAQTQSSVPEDVSSTLASDEVISEPTVISSAEDTISNISSDTLTIGAATDNDDKSEPSAEKTNFALPLIIVVIIIVAGAVAGVVVFLKKEIQTNKE